MLPEFNNIGNLPPGIHWATWEEITTRFGVTLHRKRLLLGLRAALSALQIAGCRTVFLDGSFVSSKVTPSDYDACWDVGGVNPAQLDPILLIFDNKRMLQKAKYGGELFPANAFADASGCLFIDFFQIDKHTGDGKGVVAINLVGWKP